MPRTRALDWSVGDDAAAAALQNALEEIDELYLYGSDRGRVRKAISGTALRYDVGAFSWQIGLATGTYAGSADNIVADNTTTYVMVDNTGTLQTNTTGFDADKAQLAIIVTLGGVITSITLRRPDVFGGDLGNNSPQVRILTMTTNVTLSNSSDQVQFLEPDGTDRDVTLGTTSVVEGRTFYITNTGSLGDLVLKQSSTVIHTLEAQQSCIAIYDGTNWHVTLEARDPDCGDGSDGHVTISSNTTLTRDMYYESLTVNNGIVLSTGGFRIFSRLFINLVGTGKISANGADGANGEGGNDTNTRIGGAGGTSPNGYIRSTAGVAGGDANTTNGSAPSVGTNESFAIGSNGVAGGNGGNGTWGTGRTGAIGGTATPPAATLGGYRNRENLILQRLFDANASPQQFKLHAGSGGGAPGAGGNTGNQSGGAGGGAGANAYNAVVCTKYILGSGTIEAKGGDGGDGGDMSTSTAGNRGGGGGGGGGSGAIAALLYRYRLGTVTLVVTGGVGGTGGQPHGTGTAGTNGTNGHDGIAIEMRI